MDSDNLEVRCNQTTHTTSALIRMLLICSMIWLALDGYAHAATTQKHYFGHDAQEDQYGAIAPWYKGQNG